MHHVEYKHYRLKVYKKFLKYLHVDTNTVSNTDLNISSIERVCIYFSRIKKPCYCSSTLQFLPFIEGKTSLVPF